MAAMTSDLASIERLGTRRGSLLRKRINVDRLPAVAANSSLQAARGLAQIWIYCLGFVKFTEFVFRIPDRGASCIRPREHHHEGVAAVLVHPFNSPNTWRLAVARKSYRVELLPIFVSLGRRYLLGNNRLCSSVPGAPAC